jgi:hypothetical protein
MKLKILVVAVLVLAAFSAVAYFLTRPPAPSSADPRIGQPIVDRATVGKAAQLRLTDHKATILLARQPDASWRVGSYYDLPADFDKLSRFVGDLTEAKVQRFVTANPDRLSRLELGDRQIALLDPAGHELWSVTLGKTADSGGLFIRFGDEPKAYLANLDVSIDTEPKNWADSTVLSLKPADIAKIEIGFDAAPAVVITRAKADAPFAAASTPSGQQLATEKIDTLVNQLTDLHFTDTSDPADPNAVAAKQHARTIRLTTFDGKTYVVALGRKPEEKTTKPVAAAPAAKAPAAPGTETIPAGPVYAFVTCSDPSAPVKMLMAKRACQIPDYPYTILPQKPGDLFVAAPPPAKAVAPAPANSTSPAKS